MLFIHILTGGPLSVTTWDLQTFVHFKNKRRGGTMSPKADGTSTLLPQVESDF